MEQPLNKKGALCTIDRRSCVLCTWRIQRCLVESFMAASKRAELAWQQIQFARQYTLSMITDLDHEDWFRQPTGGVTHVAWQIGHLAMAQYGLCLFRLRGRQSHDAELMSSAFRKKYSRGSAPDFEPASNPPVQQIRATLDRVHHQAARELAEVDDAVLDQPVDEPYAVYASKLGALLFCSHHEMLHAGQIGLLRRQLGRGPLR